MNDAAIRVENLGKLYHIGRAQERQDTLREALVSGLRAPVDRVRQLAGRGSEGAKHDDTIWALKDVSFEVRPGEVMGIIGRNGAGKSTLLKILSRITEPTTGRAEIHGRVGSLLEVGTGFHPELTGRENVYLNGAILGMKRVEIDRKFDEIVEFSGVAKFLDTPFKRYSSGMRVRLGFAVAAHLDPEILLVDEVLAVGDAEFQKKCLGKMGEAAASGRTVLFVSHNMSAVRQLCSQAILLAYGHITQQGAVDGTIHRYLEGVSANNGNSARPSATYLQSIEFIDSFAYKTDAILAGSGGAFQIHYDVGTEVLRNVYVTIGISDLLGARVARLATADTCEKPTVEKLSGSGQIDCQIDEIPLAPGQYLVNVAFDGYRDGGPFHDSILDGLRLTVLASNYFGFIRMKSNQRGFVLMGHRWILPQAIVGEGSSE